MLLFAQEGQPGGGAGAIGLLIYLAIIVAAIAGLWATFAKAGKPGWAAIIPIYNLIVLLEVAGKPIWWIVLFLIPCVNIVVQLLVLIDLSKAFGKSPAYAIGLWILPFVFFPMLGFGDARYQGVPS